VRTIDRCGTLTTLSREYAATYAAHIRELGRFPIVCTNAQNFAQVYQFGTTSMIGAEKMARYVEPMNEDVLALHRRLGWAYPIPRFIPITRMAEAPRDDGRALQAFGIKTSLPICVADYGEGLAARLDALLSKDYDEFTPVPARDEHVSGGGADT
jgi:hypothetical protein